MGVQISIDVTGAKPLINKLSGIDQKLKRPLRPLFESIAEEWRSAFQQIIRDQPPEWPKLSAVTVRDRAKEGFGPTPILIRKGDLLASIGTLRMEESSFSVGTTHRGAALLHFGGTTSAASRYPSRTVPARPFIRLEDVVIEDTMEMFRAYFTDDEGSGAAIA